EKAPDHDDTAVRGGRDARREVRAGVAAEGAAEDVAPTGGETHDRDVARARRRERAAAEIDRLGEAAGEEEIVSRGSGEAPVVVSWASPASREKHFTIGTAPRAIADASACVLGVGSAGMARALTLEPRLGAARAATLAGRLTAHAVDALAAPTLVA